MKKRRVAIYFFYDEEGKVDKYIDYYLSKLVENIQRLIIVCNGAVQEEGIQVFNKYTQEIIIRENIGYDAWANKAALEFIGWEQLKQYDELIITNFTLFGPFYPLGEMFDEMEDVQADFWGIFKKGEEKDLPGYGGESTIYGYIPEFILSNFWCIRKKMLLSESFREYWENLPSIEKYFDSSNKHEVVFTKWMNDKGFISSSYIERVGDVKLQECVPQPSIQMSYRLIKQTRIPFCRRRIFTNSLIQYINMSNGEDAMRMLEYIKENTEYDIDMIWENILRTVNQYDIKNSLHLNYVIQKNAIADWINQDNNTALIMYIDRVENSDYCLEYVLNVPSDMHVYIMVDDSEKKNKIQQKFANIKCSKFTIMLLETQNNILKSILIEMGDIVSSKQYEYICFMHDQNIEENRWKMIDNACIDRCFDNLLGSGSMVKNIIQQFIQNPHLGILIPAPPSHSIYYSIESVDWKMTYNDVKDWSEYLEITVPIERNKPPITPYTGMFWCKTQALSRLIDQKWKICDLLTKENTHKKTIIKLLMRVIPLLVQQAGYYPAYVLNEEYTRMQTAYQSYMINEINNEVNKYYNFFSYSQLIGYLREHLI